MFLQRAYFRGVSAFFVGWLVLALASLGLAEDEAVVATDGTPLRLSPEGGEVGAELYVTTRVQVLDEDEGEARVMVDGWAPLDDEGSPETTVFTNDSDRIRVAELPDPSVFPVAERQDEWVRLELEGWVDSDILAPDTDELYAQAREVYEQYCTGCHTGYARPVDAIRSQMPPEILPDMNEEMARGTGIADEALNLITHWLQDKPDE